MRADVTRLTYRRERRFDGVVLQQGRVQLDADWNEQADITRDRAQRTTADVVGRSGAPKDGGGFAIEPTPDRRDLTIGAGHLYVDGILCDSTPERVPAAVVSATQVKLPTPRLDGRRLVVGSWVDVLVGAGPSPTAHRRRIAGVDAAGRTLTLQVALPGVAAGNAVRVQRAPTVGAQPYTYRPLVLSGPGALAPGRYLARCEVRHSDVTPMDDPTILEPALGGVDTTTRLRVTWQVRLQAVAANASCGSLGAWKPVPPTGALRARVDPATAGPGPCLLPPTAGYQGLENQLYRVEVHQGGSAGGAGVVFKWQRDNSTVAARVVTLGKDVVVSDVGKDDVLGFSNDALAEVVDDRTELDRLPGSLHDVDNVDRATTTVTLDANPAGIDPTANPKLRRWDGRGSIAAGQWITLERGLQVQFGPGTYETGDFWLIPARTATAIDPGSIEWPLDGDGTPLSKPRDGVEGHVCALALVDFDGAHFSLVADCRPRFPALTAIEATDVSFNNDHCALDGAKTVQDAIDALCDRPTGTGNCTVVAEPGPEWSEVFALVPEGGDATVCLPVGNFEAGGPVLVENRGHLIVHGAGYGSVIRAHGHEAAIVFKGCKSVRLRDLVVEGDVGEAGKPTFLNGAVTFVDCEDVVLESVRATCEPQRRREAACIAVRNTAPAGGIDATGMSATVRGCELLVGDYQIGALILNVARASVSDNLVQARSRPQLVNVLAGHRIRDAIAKQLAAGLVIGPKPPGSTANVDLVIGGKPVSFRTHPSLVNAWKTIDVAIAGPVNDALIARHVKTIAAKLAAGRPGVTGAGVAAFAGFVASVFRAPGGVAYQGIVVAGSVVGDVWVRDNTVHGVLQGVHVAVSHREAQVGPPDMAQRARVTGNRIEVQVPREGARGRHAVFVGNCENTLVAENELRYSTQAQEAMQTEGIRVFGFLGRLAVVRGNRLRGFPVGVRFNPLERTGSPSLGKAVQWVVRDNLSETAAHVVRVGGDHHNRVRQVDNLA